MLMTLPCVCNKWVLKTLDPGKVMMRFDGVHSSCNLIREQITLVLTMNLSIPSFLPRVFVLVQLDHTFKQIYYSNFNLIVMYKLNISVTNVLIPFFLFLYFLDCFNLFEPGVKRERYRKCLTLK